MYIDKEENNSKPFMPNAFWFKPFLCLITGRGWNY